MRCSMQIKYRIWSGHTPAKPVPRANFPTMARRGDFDFRHSQVRILAPQPASASLHREFRVWENRRLLTSILIAFGAPIGEARPRGGLNSKLTRWPANEESKALDSFAKRHRTSLQVFALSRSAAGGAGCSNETGSDAGKVSFRASSSAFSWCLRSRSSRALSF